MRREEHCVGRRAMVMKVQGRRKRRRPKRRWLDKVKDDIKEKGLSAGDVYHRVITPSHRGHGATTVLGLNRHHRSDTASSCSWFSTIRHSCVFPRVAAEPQRCHCEHGDLIELQLRFDGGATAIIGGMTAVLAAALRGQ